MFRDEQLYQLIPQRPPMVMVDAVFSATDTEAQTGLTIKPQNIFVSEGKIREAGLIEHIAQSAAAFAGYGTFVKGLPPRLGYIGEIKRCNIHMLPPVGSELKTHLRLLGEAVGVSLIEAQTMVDNQPVADCQMKIFIKED